MRIGAERLLRIRKFHHGQQFLGALGGLGRRHVPVQPNGFHDLLTHGVHRVERGHGLLKNHRDLFTAHAAQCRTLQPDQLLTGQLRRAADPGVGGKQPQDGHGTRGLARTGLAHDGQHLTGGHLVIQVDRRRHPFLVHTEVHAESVHHQNRLTAHHAALTARAPGRTLGGLLRTGAPTRTVAALAHTAARRTTLAAALWCASGVVLPGYVTGRGVLTRSIEVGGALGLAGGGMRGAHRVCSIVSETWCAWVAG